MAWHSCTYIYIATSELRDQPSIYRYLGSNTLKKQSLIVIFTHFYWDNLSCSHRGLVEFIFYSIDVGLIRWGQRCTASIG